MFAEDNHGRRLGGYWIRKDWCLPRVLKEDLHRMIFSKGAAESVQVSRSLLQVVSYGSEGCRKRFLFLIPYMNLTGAKDQINFR
jgi:hypothetical protein